MRNEDRSPRLSRAGALVLALLALTAPGAGADEATRAILELPSGLVDAPAFRVAGHDPGAPRSLVLWRWDGAGPRRLAETRSDEEGRFDFGLEPLPLVRADYAVAAMGEVPDPADYRRVERRVPAPIVAAHDRKEDLLRVLVACAEGELRLSDPATGRLLARRPIDPTAAGDQAIDLATALPRVRPEALAIEHVLPDGRRSAPELWLLEGSDPARH